MRIIRVSNTESFASKIIPKQPQKNKLIVESILKNVQKYGDSAIRKYEKKFSRANLTTLRVSKQEISNAYSMVNQEQIKAITIAKTRLQKTESAVKSILKNQNIGINGIKITNDSIYQSYKTLLWPE